MDETRSAELVDSKVMNKINGKLKFLYRKIVLNTWNLKNALECRHIIIF